MTISQQDIRDSIDIDLDDIINDCDADTDREDLIERLDEACDTTFGELVKYGRIDQYDVHDLVETAADCAEIIKFAEAEAWVEDDHGLWDGLTHGVLASIAFFSLRNCYYQLLEDRGIDSNDDLPFAAKEEA